MVVYHILLTATKITLLDEKTKEFLKKVFLFGRQFIFLSLKSNPKREIGTDFILFFFHFFIKSPFLSQLFRNFAHYMEPTIVEDIVFELEPFEEDGSVLLVSESSWRGMAVELQELHYLKGAQFINQLKLIIYYGEFHLVEGETDIYSAISEKSDDFDNLTSAARKAVEHGYRVYILPNPKGIRTADFIFERKGVYKMFDLKTITGKNSVDNRLSESIGQANRVLLHMTAEYNPGTLARSIKRYFEFNPYAREVLVYKGKKQISVTKKSLEDTNFFRTFIRRYAK